MRTHARAAARVRTNCCWRGAARRARDGASDCRGIASPLQRTSEQGSRAVLAVEELETPVLEVTLDACGGPALRQRVVANVRGLFVDTGR